MRTILITLILASAQLTAYTDTWADTPADTPGTSVSKLQPRQQSVTIKHHTLGDTPILGPRFAPVTVDFFIRFSDMYYTRRILSKLRLLAKRHPTRMRIVFRPVERLTYSYRFLAEAALEAYAQGKFFEFMAAVHKQRRRPPRQQMKKIAIAAGMDADRLEKALITRRHKAAMEANYNYYMQRFHLTSLQEPLLFNGKKPVTTSRYRRRTYWASRSMNLDQLENTYDEAYKRGKVLLAGGVSLHKLYRAVVSELDAKRPLLRVARGYLDNQPRNWHRNKTARRPLRGKVDLSGPHSRGPKHAPVTIAFYCSFNGQRCKTMKTNVMDKIANAYPKQVRLVFKHLYSDKYQGTSTYYRRRWFPPTLLHEASLCADEQGAFWRYYDTLYKYGYRYRSTKPTLAQVKQHAKQAQLDTTKFVHCLTSHRHLKRLKSMVAAARKANVVHTPSLVIGGRLYEGTKKLHEVMSLVRRELAPGWLRTRWPSEDENRPR